MISEDAQKLDAAWLRRLCLDAGADDVGFVDIASPELDGERAPVLREFPKTKSLISLVCKMNRGPIRSPARSLANLEFHHVGDQVNETARAIVRELESRGVWAVNPAMGFPMEMDRFPDRMWAVSHKPVAIAAGMGRMGVNRLVRLCHRTRPNWAIGGLRRKAKALPLHMARLSKERLGLLWKVFVGVGMRKRGVADGALE